MKRPKRLPPVLDDIPAITTEIDKPIARIKRKALGVQGENHSRTLNSIIVTGMLTCCEIINWKVTD